MPEEVRAFIDKHLIGEWTSEKTFEDQSGSGETKAAWAEGGHCVITHGVETDFDGSRMHTTTVLGWDAVHKCLVDFSISSKGAWWGYRWTILKEDEWTGDGKGLYQNKEWSGPATLQFGENVNRYEDETDGKPYVVVWKRKAT